MTLRMDSRRVTYLDAPLLSLSRQVKGLGIGLIGTAPARNVRFDNLSRTRRRRYAISADRRLHAAQIRFHLSSAGPLVALT
jgi:hypothetical protein